MQSIRKQGKTTRDRASGAFSRNASNKASRASWENETSGHTNEKFPSHTCAGQKNRPNGNGRRTRNAGPKGKRKRGGKD